MEVMRSAFGWIVVACACTRSKPLPPVPTVFSSDESGRICATLEACFPAEWNASTPIWGRTVSACTTDTGYVPEPGTMAANPIVIDGFEPAFTRLYDCILAAASDCTAAAACFSQTGSPGQCAPNSLSNGKCSGSVLSGCTADGISFATDCAVDGETCGPYPSIFGTYNGCVTPCPSQPVCEGTKEQVCLKSLVLVDCAALGEPCANGGCVAPTPHACDPQSYAARCDGTVALGCNSSSRQETRQDCAIWPTRRRCAVNQATNSAACVATGQECSSETESCDSADIVYCHDGFVARVSCTAIGFSSCSGGRCVL
jgi:hypothetical protein